MKRQNKDRADGSASLIDAVYRITTQIPFSDFEGSTDFVNQLEGSQKRFVNFSTFKEMLKLIEWNGF